MLGVHFVTSPTLKREMRALGPDSKGKLP